MKFTLAAAAAAGLALVSSVAASPTNMHHKDEHKMAPLYTPPNVFGDDAAGELGIQSSS